MGDRTFVTLTIRRSDRERAMPIIKDFGPDDEDEMGTSEADGDLNHSFQFYDVNYGELPFLGALQEAGIPYDSVWEQGGSYGPGQEICRYTDDGELRVVVEPTDGPAIGLDLLLKTLPDYNALATLVRECRDMYWYPDWECQDRNSKLFRTKQLLRSKG